jgi:outer membrane protein TolC
MNILSRKCGWVALLLTCLCGRTFAQETISLSLEKAIEIALSENPTIRVADKEITLKEAARKEAIWGLFPEADLTGSYTRTIEKQTFAMGDQQVKVGTKNNYNGGVAISLPVFAPTLYQSIRLTKEDVKLAVEKSRESRLDMVNQVTKAFYQLLLAQDSYEVLQKSYAQSEENYRVVSAKYQQGTVSEYDKISAEVQMRSIKPSVVSARNGVNLAKLQLKVLMGMTAENEIEAQGNLKDHETELFARQLNDTSLSLAENSTLKQLDLNEAMLQRNLKIQKSNFLPTLALSFQYLYTTLTNDFKFSDYKWNPYSTVALSFSMPLFKGSNFSKVKQAKIQLEELKENRRNTELQLQMQATTYLDNMTASTEQVVSNREAVAQAEKGRLIAEKRYEVGKGTILELNNSEVALTQAELTYNQSIFDYLSAQADLDKVLGKQYPVTTKE